MKKIYVKYKDICLGELSFDNNNFCYKTYEQNIAKANSLGYLIDLYNVDKSFVSASLPYSLDDFIPNKQTRAYEMAGILDSDNDFEKLFKIASLNLSDMGLYVDIKN